MTIRMRIALKIGYDGKGFHGYQRQPEVRTVEGEAIAALRSARVMPDHREAFFRSASRTDRGVSAVGNVIAFNTTVSPRGIIGAFNDRARGVWAWGLATVPPDFHPRRADERWYRYHLFEDLPVRRLREAAAGFVGTHDFSSFSSDSSPGPSTINRIDIQCDDGAILVDVRARSFRRGMVRRIVAALRACARGEIDLGEIEASLRGRRQDFGTAPAEPLVLMDVRYPILFDEVPTSKVRDEWRAMKIRADLRGRLVRSLEAAVGRRLSASQGARQGKKTKTRGALLRLWP